MLQILFEVLPHLFASLGRVLSGVCIGVILASVIAILVPIDTTLGLYINRLIYSVQPVPKIIFFPFIFIALGIGEISKITILAIYGFFQTFVVVRDSIMMIDDEYRFLMQSMRSSHFNTVKHVILPHSLPYIFTGIRSSIGTAFAVLFIVESFATTNGIGYYLINAWSIGASQRLLLTVSLIAVTGLTITKITKLIEYHFIRWKKQVKLL